MGELTLRKIYVDKLLTNYSVGYTNGKFIADIVAPFVTVQERTGIFFKFGFENFQLEDDDWAIGAPANEVTWSPTQDTFLCVGKALKQSIPDEILNSGDGPVQVGMRTVRRLKDLIMVKREKRVADILRDDTIFDHKDTLSSTEKWDAYDEEDSQPLLNIIDAKNAVYNAIWAEATHIIIPRTVAEKSSLHPDFTELQKYTKGDLIQDGSLPSVIKGLKVLIPSAGMTTGETASPTEIWGTDVIVMYIDSNPGVDSLNTVSTFVKSRGRVRRWFDDETECHKFEFSMILGEKVVCAGGAYIIKGVLT